MPTEFTHLFLLDVVHRLIISAIKEAEARLEGHKLKACLSNLDCLKTTTANNLPPTRTVKNKTKTKRQGLGRSTRLVVECICMALRKTKKTVVSQAVVVHSALGRQNQWISELKSNLVYKLSSRTARTTKRIPVLKKQKNRKKENLIVFKKDVGQVPELLLLLCGIF